MRYEELKEYFHSFRQGLISKTELMVVIHLWQRSSYKLINKKEII